MYKEFEKVYTLQNNLNPNNFDNNLKVTNYLEPKFYEPRIILQQVKRYQKTFFIFTIEYSQPFDIWNIKIYNPRSSRTFLATINFNTILNWRVRFYEKVYPHVMDEIDIKGVKDYQSYILQLKKQSLIKTTSRKNRKQSIHFDVNEQKLSNEERRVLEKMDRMYYTRFLNHFAPNNDLKYILWHE